MVEVRVFFAVHRVSDQGPKARVPDDFQRIETESATCLPWGIIRQQTRFQEVLRMGPLKAVIFDQDGVLVDTERDGHRVAFNAAFKEFGFDFEWGVETYGKLLKIGGGKERIRHDFLQRGLGAGVEDFDDLIARLHRRKTEIFVGLLQDAKMVLRPGVRRLVGECRSAGLKLAVCSTASEKAVNTLVDTLIGRDFFDVILAGDVVKEKKPNPAIYNMVKARLDLNAEECIVVEDNRNGLVAAKGAGFKCIITVNHYTKDEDFGEADLVVTCLGDSEKNPAKILAGPPHISIDSLVTLATLRELLGS